MARPAISETVKIRRQIIALDPEDFADLLRDIEMIQEIYEEIQAKAAEKEQANIGAYAAAIGKAEPVK